VRELMQEADRVSLVAGVAIMVLGGLLVLDQAGAISLTPGWIGAAVAATVGVILLVSGIADRES
jgi:uncharacterized YccA/Bax inhibitor family protein